MVNGFRQLQSLLNESKRFEFVVLLALRLYLAPIFIMAGLNKLNAFEGTVAWFGGSLGLPFPTLMASLAIGAELIGGIALLIGFATRWFAIPLIVTMLVAAFSVHIKDGWYAIAPTSSSNHIASLMQPEILSKVGIDGPKEALDQVDDANVRLNRARSILKENSNYAWITQRGSFVILNNGIEFAITYLLMLLVLLFNGAGRFVSIDYWIDRKVKNGLKHML